MPTISNWTSPDNNSRPPVIACTWGPPVNNQRSPIIIWGLLLISGVFQVIIRVLHMSARPWSLPWPFFCNVCIWPSPLISPMSLTLNSPGQILKLSYFKNSWSDWLGTKAIWNDKMFDHFYDFEPLRHSWPWHWIFKVKFWNSHNSGLGGLTDLKILRIQGRKEM